MAEIYLKANKEIIAKTQKKLGELTEAINDYLNYANNTLFSDDVKDSLKTEIGVSNEYAYMYNYKLAGILNYAGNPSDYGKSKIAKQVRARVTNCNELLLSLKSQIEDFESKASLLSLKKMNENGALLLHGNIIKTNNGIDKWTYTWETLDGKKVELSLDEMVNATVAHTMVTMDAEIQGKIFTEESNLFEFTTDYANGIMGSVNSVLDEAAVAGKEQGLDGSYYDILLEDGIRSVVTKIDNSKGVPGLYEKTISDKDVRTSAAQAYDKTREALRNTNSNVLTSAAVGSTYLGAFALTGFINNLISGDKAVDPAVNPGGGSVTPDNGGGSTLTANPVGNGDNEVPTGTQVPTGDGNGSDNSTITNPGDSNNNGNNTYVDEEGDLVTEIHEDTVPIEEENEDEEGHEPGDEDPDALKDLEEQEDEEPIEEIDDDEEDEELVEEIDEEEDEEPIEEIEEDEEGHEPGDDDPDALKDLEEQDDGKVIEITEYTPEEIPEVKEVELSKEVTKDYDQLAIDEYKASVEANPQIEAAKQADWIQEFDDLYRNNPEQLRQNLKQMGYSDSDIAKMVAENDDAYLFGRDCYINGKRNLEIAEMANNFAKADGVTDYNTRFDDANSGLINQLDIDYSKDATISDLNTKLDSASSSYKSSYGEYSSLADSYKDSNEKIENFRKTYGDASGWTQSQADEWNKMVDENDDLYKRLMVASNTVTENEKQYLDLKQKLITAKTSYIDNMLKNRQVEIQNISTANVNVEPLKPAQGTGDGVTLADINNLL